MLSVCGRAVAVAGLCVGAGAMTAQGQLVVDQDLGIFSTNTGRLLTGSYAGRPSNAQGYNWPNDPFPLPDRDMGEYVFRFTTAVRGRVDLSWLVGQNSPPPVRTQMMAITDTLAVDAAGFNQGVRLIRFPPISSPQTTILEAGTYYAVFDDSSVDPLNPGGPPLNPSGNFSALLNFEKLQLSAPITGATSVDNLWARPYRPGAETFFDEPGFRAGYAGPFAFYVSEAGFYSTANISATFDLQAWFYREPGVVLSASGRNVVSKDVAFLQPGQQYYLMVSTNNNVVSVPGVGFLDPYIETPGPFSFQLEGPGTVTFGLIPSPSAGAVMGLWIAAASRRRRRPKLAD